MKAKAEFLIFLIIKDRMNFLVTCNGYNPMENIRKGSWENKKLESDC